jgi:hypothetical protein
MNNQPLETIDVQGVAVDILSEENENGRIEIAVGTKEFELKNATEEEGRLTEVYSGGDYLTEVYGVHFRLPKDVGTLVDEAEAADENKQIILTLVDFYLD